jgi:hypothetical protein
MFIFWLFFILLLIHPGISDLVVDTAAFGSGMELRCDLNTLYVVKEISRGVACL